MNELNVNDVLALVKAGFTSDQISNMMTKTTPAEPTIPVAAPQSTTEQPASAVKIPAEEATKPVAKEEQSVHADVDKSSAKEKTPNYTKMIADLSNQVANLTKIIQTGNLNSARQPEISPLSAEDVLSEIIRPVSK